MKTSFAHTTAIALTAALISLNAFAQTDASTNAPRAELPPVPAPMAIPNPGPQTDQPYAPQPILPGGIIIPLWPPDSPFLNPARVREPEGYTRNRDVPGRVENITNIHNPSIEVHLIGGGGTGAACILCAGGAHDTLNVGPEGSDFFTFFRDHGITTIILRNRLRTSGYNPYTDECYDALRALRIVRSYAAKWRIDPHRIGIMGFSAGAELATASGLLYPVFDAKYNDPSDPFSGVTSRPDFVGSIYPGPSPFSWSNPPPIVISPTASQGVKAPEIWDWHKPPVIPRDHPPSFTANGGGDQNGDWALTYFDALYKARVPNVEMHIYGNGHHGGSLLDRGGTPYGTWSDRFIEWVRDLGFLSKPGDETKAAKDIVAFINRPPRGRRGGPGARGAGTNAPAAQMPTR